MQNSGCTSYDDDDTSYFTLTSIIKILSIRKFSLQI